MRKAQTVGRVLGIGLRVAGRMAGQSFAGESRANTPVPVAGVPVQSPRTTGRQTGRTTANAARGVGGFLRPFRRVGSIVFLEVTGVFFFLFVLIFGSRAWKLRASFAQGPDHARFLLFAALALVFLYLGLSSFWRARRK